MRGDGAAGEARQDGGSLQPAATAIHNQVTGTSPTAAPSLQQAMNDTRGGPSRGSQVIAK